MTDRRYFGPSWQPRHWSRPHYKDGPIAIFGGPLEPPLDPPPVPIIEAEMPIEAPVHVRLVLGIPSATSPSWSTQRVPIDRHRRGKFPAYSLVVFLEHPTREDVYRATLYTIDLEGHWTRLVGCHSRVWAKMLAGKGFRALADAQQRQQEWVRENAPEDPEAST